MIRRAWWLACVLTLMVLPAPARAVLTDTWDQRYEGIRHLTRTGTDVHGAYQIYHLALVDLTNPSIGVRTVLNNDTWEGAKERVSSMAVRHDAALAVNGDYWNWGVNDPSQGTTAVEGMCYRAHPDRSALAFSSDLIQAEIGRFGTWPIADPPPDDCPAWFHNAVGGGPQFIFGGAAQWNESANPNDGSMVDINGDTWFGSEAWNWDDGRQPNTAVGISQDGQTLILVTCDGRGAGGADGCRMASDMVDIMLEFGACDALKLDSGGSTTFFYDGVVQNNPSDGSERHVVDALIVQSALLSCEVTLQGGVTVIDDGSPCFTRLSTWWWTAPAGQGGMSWYTWATDDAVEDCVGTWSFGVTQVGPYLVEVYIPDLDTLSQQASYGVDPGSGEVAVVVDQAAARNTWAALGTFDFAAAGHVRLPDNSGEPYGSGNDRRIVYDAVRFTWAGAGSDAGVSDAGLSDGGGGSDAALRPDGAPPGDGTIPADGGSPPPTDPDGCGCRTSNGPSASRVLLAALLFGILWRRRPSPELPGP